MIALLAACGGVLSIAQSANGQATEFRMDESGNWVQVRGPAVGTEEADIAQARRDLAEDRPADANRVISTWIDRNDRVGSPYLPEALVIRGDALTALGDEYEALYDYERVIKEFPGSAAFVTSIERELDIAVRYVTGLKRRFFGVRMLSATDIGEELLIRVQERMPGSRLAERAGIELADHYYRNRDLELSSEAYDLFIENYPNSQYRQRAMQRRIYATIGRFKGPRYDGSALIDAQILTKRFASLYPTEAQESGLDDGLLARLDESAGQEYIETAKWYLRRDDPISARLILRRCVREHPKTAAAQQAIEILNARGWPITTAMSAPAAQNADAKPDFAAGVTGAAVEGEPKTTTATESQAKPDKPATETERVRPTDERPPPVEPRERRMSPAVPPAPTPTPASAPSAPPTPAPASPPPAQP